MNTQNVHYLNLFLGYGAILLQSISVFVLFLLFFISKKSGNENIILSFIKKNFLIIIFLLSFFASVFSLIYSEIIGFVPCELCWFQRVFLFPQVFLSAVAMWNKDKTVIKYSLPLLCIGFAIAIYQNLIYYFTNSSNTICGSSGTSCYQHLISEFGGYVSIPMLSLTSFFTIIVVILVVHFYKKND